MPLMAVCRAVSGSQALLQGCTRIPRCWSKLSRPSVTVVLPQPLPVPARMNARLPYPVLFWRSGYSYAHAVLRPRTAKPPTSHRSCWSVTGRQVFWLSLVLARPSQSFDQWFLRGRQHHSSRGCGGFTPFPDTKLVSTPVGLFRRCALHRRVLLYVFFYRFITRHNDVSEGKRCCDNQQLSRINGHLSHHKNKNWCSLSLEYHYFCCAMTIYCSTVVFHLY